MSSLWIQNASAIVTCDPRDSVLEHTGILIQDGVITSIDQAPHDADQVLDAAGCIVYPGLINTHHHLYQTFSRNLPQVQNLELFPWLKALYEIWKGLDEEAAYYSALTGLRLEARQKLGQIRPQNLGQAGRISGVSPADVAALMIHLERLEREHRP